MDRAYAPLRLRGEVEARPERRRERARVAVRPSADVTLRQHVARHLPPPGAAPAAGFLGRGLRL